MPKKIAKKKSIAVETPLEQKSLRDGFGEGLVLAGGENKNVVVLSADLKESTRCEKFAAEFPGRFIETGVAEQNMAGLASGLAASGKIPFISSYAVFSPGRNWEQIRTTICYNNVGVKIAGHHAGVSTGPDGATHQAAEDIAITRALPNMKVIAPCDAVEARKAVLAAIKIAGPVYIRLAREKTAILTKENDNFVPGKASELWTSAKKPQVAIVGAGPILAEALSAAKELESEGIGAIVLNCHTIKPLDENKILEAAKKCGAIVSVEEHSVVGGLGSAIAELLAQRNPLPMEFIGIKDKFGQSGTPEELYKKYELDKDAIIKAVKKVVRRK